LHKVANRQTDRQTSNDGNITSLAEVTRKICRLVAASQCKSEPSAGNYAATCMKTMHPVSKKHCQTNIMEANRSKWPVWLMKWNNNGQNCHLRSNAMSRELQKLTTINSTTTDW